MIVPIVPKIGKHSSSDVGPWVLALPVVALIVAGIVLYILWRHCR